MSAVTPHPWRQYALAAALGAVAIPVLAGSAPPEVPDARLTPGAVASTDTADVCGHAGGLSYSQQHRHTEVSVKVAIMREYGKAPGRAGDGEIDHLVPLCLGGADRPANLWWQPGDGQGASFTYHDKDRLEAEACREVCEGKVPVATAQAWFLAPADWRTAYCRHFADARCR